MASLRIAREERDRSLVLQPARWIDISNVAELDAEFQRGLARPGLEAIGIDFSHTDYIDSATIAALIRAKSQAEEARCRFGLIALSEQVGQVLRETHLIEIFPVFRDREAFFQGSPEEKP